MSSPRKRPDTGTPETKPESKNETVNKILEVAKKVVEEARRVAESAPSDEDAWYSVVLKTVPGQNTELVLQLSINARLGAVMYTIRTPMIRGRANMIKLPTMEHVDLLLQLAKWMEQKRDSLAQLFEAVTRELGVERRPRRKPTVREEIEL